MTQRRPENDPEVEALFPSDTQPENRTLQVSSICSYGTRPHAMTGFLRAFLTDHFCDPENTDDERIRRRLTDIGAWKPSETRPGEETQKGGILIEPLTKWVPTESMQRQSLIIKRNSWNWDRVIIGDSDGDEFETGTETFMGFWRGSHTVFAIAQHGAEAEILATEVMRFMQRFGPAIVEQMNLHRFVPVGMDELHQIEEVADHYVVPVTVAYAAEERWSLTPWAPRLKRFTLRTSDLL